jgi:hypothetical protein
LTIIKLERQSAQSRDSQTQRDPIALPNSWAFHGTLEHTKLVTQRQILGDNRCPADRTRRE